MVDDGRGLLLTDRPRGPRSRRLRLARRLRRALLRAGPRVERSLVHGLGAPAARTAAPSDGPPVRVDGQELDIQAQLLIRLATLAGQPETHELTVGEARASFRESARSLSGPEVPIARVDHLTIPGPEGPLAARLYIPQNEDEGSGLSRLASPTRSSTPASSPGRRARRRQQRGGNRGRCCLAAPPGRSGTGLPAALLSLARPVEQAPLLQPLRHGLLPQRGKPRLVPEPLPQGPCPGTGRPLLAAARRALRRPAPYLYRHRRLRPPTRRRREYAQRLRQAGVPVALHLHPGAIHGFANLIAVGHLARDPLLAAAGALRVGLAAAGTD